MLLLKNFERASIFFKNFQIQKIFYYYKKKNLF